MKRPVIALGVVGLFLLVGLLVGLADLGLAGGLIIGAGLVCLIPVFASLLRGEHDIFEPSYLFALAFGVLFVIRPALEWSATHGVPTMGGLDPTPTYLAAIAIATLGAISFYAGYFSPVGTHLAHRLPASPEVLHPGRVWTGALGVAVLGIGMYVAFLMTTGGLGSFAVVIAGRNPDFVSSVSQPAGYLYSGLQFLFPAGVILLVSARRWMSLNGLAGLAMVAMSVVPQFFTGSRSATLPALLTLGLLWYLRRASRPRLVTMLSLALVGFVLVISVPRDYRNTDDRTGSLVDAVASSIANAEATGREFILGLDTAMLPAFAIEVSEVPGSIPFQFGSTYVEAALRPIPRAFWSAKPDAAETQLMRVFWPDLAAQRISLTFSLFGEPFLNFGLLGVVAISALFGVAWRGLWEYWRRQPANPVAIGIFAISWPFLFVYLRGGIGVDYQRQVIALLPFVALAWFAARGSVARARAHSTAGRFRRIDGPNRPLGPIASGNPDRTVAGGSQ